MQEYSEVTPVITLTNGKQELDILNSSYTNIRWGVAPEVIITIDAKYEANLPGLAFDYYGDQKFWRAILTFNGLSDPMSDICVGAVIGLPSRASLDSYMTSKNIKLNQSLVI